MIYGCGQTDVSYDFSTAMVVFQATLATQMEMKTALNYIKMVFISGMMTPVVKL